MSFSSSYLQLDGVEFKISDVVNPPSLPNLPKEFIMKDVSALLKESQFDFSLETSVLAKISSAREAEKKLLEQEEQRKMLSMKRRADAEKRRLEEMMSQQREVLQKKRKEFLEQKRKNKEKMNGDSSSESTSPTSDISSSTTKSPTYENVPTSNAFSLDKDGILKPQLVAGLTPESSFGNLNQSQPVISGQNQIWEDFEDKELDPFTNAELKSIDDLAELQTVLQNAKIGQGLRGFLPQPATTEAELVKDSDRNSSCDHLDASPRTPSPHSSDSSSDASVNVPLYENVSLKEVHEIATKLEKSQEKEIPINSNITKLGAENPETKISDKLESLYAKINKTQDVPTSLNQSIPVQTCLNPNNPFLNSFEGPGTVTNSQLPSNLRNPIGQNPPMTEASLDPSVLFTNPFNPVTSSFPISSTFTTSSGSTSPIFFKDSKPGIEIPNSVPDQLSKSGNPKILPVSFGAISKPVSTPTPQPKPFANPGNQPKTAPKAVRPAPKPPMPAPRKPAVPPRHPTNSLNGTQVTPTVQNGPASGRSHLLPPYSILPNGNEASSTAPSTEAGFINKSKQDRAKFAETVNKALSSLPQNPKPIKKTTQPAADKDLRPPLPVNRALSLKSSLIAGLSSDEQTFVKDVMAMGFDGEATVRAMQRLGLDSKEVVDHLIQVQGIVDQGYSTRIVQDALEMYPEDGKSAVKYIQQISQLTDMGFPEDKVREALKHHGNDQTKALDQLMENT